MKRPQVIPYEMRSGARLKRRQGGISRSQKTTIINRMHRYEGMVYPDEYLNSLSLEQAQVMLADLVYMYDDDESIQYWEERDFK